MANYFTLQSGTGRILLQDASGLLMLQSNSTVNATGSLAGITLTPANGTAKVSDTGSVSLSSVALTPASGTANIGDTGSGSLGNITLTPANGTARIGDTGSGSLSGIPLTSSQAGVILTVTALTLDAISLTPANGDANVSNVTTGTGSLHSIALTPATGEAKIGDTGIGSLSPIALTPASGNAAISRTVSVSLSVISLTPVSAKASVKPNSSLDAIQLTAGSASAIDIARGALSGISLTPVNATISVSMVGSGVLDDIQLTPAQGIGASAEGNGSGPLEAISLTPANATVTIDYDIHKTIIWQYSASNTILKLVRDKSQIFDAQALENNFISKIWDVRTASGFGLDILGRIVGIGRYLNVTNSGYFGFEQVFTPFDDKPFFHGNPINNQYRLGDDDYRRVILAKAANNISGGSIPELENILNLLFGKLVKVRITGFAELTYEFHFTPSDVELAIINTPGLLPQPAGNKIIRTII